MLPPTFQAWYCPRAWILWNEMHPSLPWLQLKSSGTWGEWCSPPSSSPSSSSSCWKASGLQQALLLFQLNRMQKKISKVWNPVLSGTSSRITFWTWQHCPLDSEWSCGFYIISAQRHSPAWTVRTTSEYKKRNNTTYKNVSNNKIAHTQQNIWKIMLFKILFRV